MSRINVNQLVGIGIILLALYVIIKNTIGFNFIPEVNQSMGYGILFMVGLLTSLHLFSMGTVPLMFGFGAISSMLGKRFTGKLLKVSAVFVMVLGFIRMGRGLTLSGINTTFADSTPSGNVAVAENGVQVVSIDLKPNRYDPIVVQKGIPVKFIINAEAAVEINSLGSEENYVKIN